MAASLSEQFAGRIAGLDRRDPLFVPRFVDEMLAAGQAAGASDLHLQPTADGVEMKWRLDGVLQRIGAWPIELAPNLVARLKVLAELLTYRTEIPQEGRIRRSGGDVELRVSTFPTLYGEKAVVRLFPQQSQLRHLAELGLPVATAATLLQLLAETSGALILAGPAGSGKTTTLYACLRQLAAQTQGARSLVTLEDPIEVAVPGVTQSAINVAAGFDFAVGLRSLLRQDPEVIMVGEIRDRPTAEATFQAALTGHLVLTTVHAGSAAGALARLADMGIEPYLLRSGVLGILCQRLVRRLCRCATWSDDPEQLGLVIPRARVANGCEACAGTGYHGRAPLAELLLPHSAELGRAILARADAPALEALAQQTGMRTLWQGALVEVSTGMTSPAEIRRVLGIAASGSENGPKPSSGL